MTPLKRQIADLFHPLTDFYAAHHTSPPQVEAMAGADMPQPYRDLLVHERDMTTTLERYWKSSLTVKVLEKHVSDDRLTRQVVLVTDQDGTPAEFGAIRINLNLFDAAPREEILACERPLGTILTHHAIGFTCRPNAYFSFAGDAVARRAFGLTGAFMLHGRHNLLMDTAGEILAEVVEILPPLKSPGESE
jgi:chorismate-pyruvate lyase